MWQSINKKSGKIMTTGRLRDLGDIEKPIQQHNGYYIFPTVTLLASPVGNQPKRISIIAMI
jgi:hypothetical protein